MNNEQKLQVATDALNKLACLGNGNVRGNSIGNDIAATALAILAAPSTEQPTATAGDRSTLSRAIDCLEILNKRPRPMCRDCADEDGTCQHGGLACDMRGLIAESRACIAQAAPAGDAVAVLPKELVERVIARLSTAQIFPLAAELRRALAATERAATQPAGEALYAVIYDDADMRPAIVIGEEAARATFKRIGGHGYNAHLFVKLESNSRDDPHYNANLTTPAPDLSAQQPAAASVEDVKLRAAVDARFPIPTSPHGSVMTQNALNRAAFESGWNALADAAQKERDDLRAQLAHWKSNHDQLAARCAILRERDDLPVDRLPAYRELVRLQEASPQLARPADLAGLTRYECGIVNREYNVVGLMERPTGRAVLFTDVQALLATKTPPGFDSHEGAMMAEVREDGVFLTGRFKSGGLVPPDGC